MLFPEKTTKGNERSCAVWDAHSYHCRSFLKNKSPQAPVHEGPAALQNLPKVYLFNSKTMTSNSYLYETAPSVSVCANVGTDIPSGISNLYSSLEYAVLLMNHISFFFQKTLHLSSH